MFLWIIQNRLKERGMFNEQQVNDYLLKENRQPIKRDIEYYLNLWEDRLKKM